MKNWLFVILIFSVSVVLFGINLISDIREKYLEIKFDLISNNPRIESQEEVERVLNSYRILDYREIEEGYKEWTKSDEPKYKNILRNSKYRVIRQNDFFRKIVGDFRVKDFICRDSIYRKCLFDKRKDYYWLIDEKLAIAVFKLQRSLKEKGYNPDGFWIRYGHRHPKKNEEVEGAGSSKHIKGEAIDMVIGDINRDGKYTEKDKEIVLEISEKEIIGNKGGIGRYPGTRTIHIDTRGKRARWDSY